MKVFAIVLGAVIFLCLLLVAAGYFWYSSNEANFEKEAQAAYSEAVEVSEKGDSYACLEHIKARVKKCSSLTCQIGHRFFIEQCLALAPVAPGLCAKVPADSMVESAKWALEQCSDMGESVQACVQAFTYLPEFCQSSGNNKSDGPNYTQNHWKHE